MMSEINLGNWAQDDEEIAFANWLKFDTDAILRHKILMEWNWDDGDAVIRFIISQKDCDQASIKEAYWLSQPHYYLNLEKKGVEIPHINQSGYDLCKFLTDTLVDIDLYPSNIKWDVPFFIEQEITRDGFVRADFPNTAWVETKGNDVTRINYPESAPIWW